MSPLQTTGSKDEPNIVLREKHYGHHTAELRTERRIIGQHTKNKENSNTDPTKSATKQIHTKVIISAIVVM